eukprot:TRINITY_DN55785_c0_g1_i1.p1 TRINITY_DN55785_c0_g1~~TRINITY_DN55785_c0_g1_i1.p1  ORF type:complete len:161 (+),score=6.37 TRINITY_DN55785_c0_g1_i1:175-657(+)
MLFMDVFQIILLLLFSLVKVACVFFPDLCLLIVNLFFIKFFLFFLFNLFSKILSHFGFLDILLLFSSLLVLPLSFKLILYVSHHLLIFSLDLFFLVFDNRISKRSHNFLDFLFPLFLFLLSSLLEFILKSCILFLRFDIFDSFSFSFFSQSSLIFIIFFH